MLVYTNNRHWVDKNCLPWSKEYFENYVNYLLEKDGFSFSVSSIKSVEGDCDVTQRKGRVLCIFDMVLEFEISGSKDEENFLATIGIPEFVHDQEDDEYVFNVTGGFTTEVKKYFVPEFKSKLMQFQPDLIKAHEKDVQHTSN